MQRSAFAVSKAADFSVMILAGIVILPTLPFRFTLEQLAIVLLGTTSAVMAARAFSNLIYAKHAARDRAGIIECLFLVILAYVALQLIPLPRFIVNTLSPSMAALWQIDAYGLENKAVMTADISATVWFLITWCSYYFLFTLLYRQISKNWHFVLITTTIFLIGLSQIIFDELSKYLGYEYITAGQTDGHSYRLTGTFVNSNNLSALINLSIAAGLTLIVYIRTLSSKFNVLVFFIAAGFIIAGELLLLYGLIKAGSAGGLLSLIMSVFIVVTVLITRQFSFRLLAGLFIFVILILAILAFYGSRELNIAEIRENLSLSGRPILWLSVIEMWRDFPVFGIGAGAFEWVFPMYKSDAVTPLRVFTAHSGYLHLAVETGLAGVLLGTLFVMACSRKILSIFNRSRVHRHLTSALMVGVLAFIIHECVETNLLIPPVAILFFSLLALTLSSSKLNFHAGQSS